MDKKVVIIGSGCFGLSSAYSLLKEGYKDVTVIDRSTFPALDAASTDLNKIIRADYADDLLYSSLALESIKMWSEWNKNRDESQPPLINMVGVLFLTSNSKEISDIDKKSVNLLTSLGVGDSIQIIDSEQKKSNFLNKKPGCSSLFKTHQSGYFNKNAGWIDSTEGLKYLYKKTSDLGCKFIIASFDGFIHDNIDQNLVTGVATSNGTFNCDLAIMATGAWTSKLFSASKEIFTATGQSVVHIKIPEHLIDTFSSPSFCVWASDIVESGFYGFPVRKGDLIMKIANHGYGYTNLQKSSLSTPKTVFDDPKLQIPNEFLARFKTFLDTNFPSLKQGDDYKFASTRLCWYNDTFDGDFYIDRVPNSFTNVVLATGGSGHAMKFLPLLGSFVLDVCNEVLRIGGPLKRGGVKRFRAREKVLSGSDCFRGGVIDRKDLDGLEMAII